MWVEGCVSPLSLVPSPSVLTPQNPWLTYGLPLHRAREFGVRHKLFDLLDERALLPSEIYEFIQVRRECKLKI